MKSRKLTCVVALILFAAVPTALASTTWYVNGVSGSNSNNCLSASTPCKTIGHAIYLAHSGDSIRVAAATYTGGLTIPKSRNLTIVGSGAIKTIIDGHNHGPVLAIPPNSRVIISGITIRNGQALYGAGIRNSGVLTVSRSILVGNVAFDGCGDGCSSFSSGRGGAVFNTGTMIISNSTLTQNSASKCIPIFFPRPHIVCSGLGGGIWNAGTLTINDDTLSANGFDQGRGDQGRGGGIFNVGGIVTVTTAPSA